MIPRQWTPIVNVLPTIRQVSTHKHLKANVGLVKNLSSSYDKATQRLLRDSIAILKAQGATVIEEIELPHLADLDKLELPVLLYDFKADLNQYLAAALSQVKVRTMADVMRFNQTHRQQVMPYFGQEIMQMASQSWFE